MIKIADLLAGLTSEERAAFERVLEPRRFAPGDKLFVQGAAPDGVHFVQRGHVQLRVRLPGGDPSELARVGPGEVLGELLLGSGARTASAAALDEVETRFMGRDEFLALYANFHPISFKLMHKVACAVARRIVATTAALGQGATLQAPVDLAADGGLRPGAFFDPRPFLPRLRFFRAFTPREIDALLAQGSLCTARRGCVLFRTGDPSDAAYVVVRGAVEVLTGSDAALERIGLLGPGAMAGELAALLDGARAATCRVREDAVLLCIPAIALRSLLDPAHRLSFKFLRALLAGLVVNLERTNRTLAAREHARRCGPSLPKLEGEPVPNAPDRAVCVDFSSGRPRKTQA